MVTCFNEGIFLLKGKEVVTDNHDGRKQLAAKDINTDINEAKKNTIAYSILEKHNISGDMERLNIKFDALTSHDITYVGIIQTAKASGLTEFPVPYVLTNCHNSLCSVGGTINEDDHVFGLSSAKKYGGIYVPPHFAVIHQYMREIMAGCGKMILGSDSHTRYGALGTMAIGEGGGELVKQLLQKTYDISYPKVIGVCLSGQATAYVGPQDVALSIIGAVFKSGFVKNAILEFFGDGIDSMSVDFRNGIDVMTTETTCLSSIWKTDGKVEKYYADHGRGSDYKKLSPGDVAYYDGLIHVDLSKIKPMIAMPFHPSNVYTIDEFNNNKLDILASIEEDTQKQFSNNEINFGLQEKVRNGRFYIDQCIVAGCAGGTYENICDIADIAVNNDFSDCMSMSIYPASQAIYNGLLENNTLQKLIKTGAIIKTAFCGPCFGAGDIPGNNQFSIRHATRNFKNREGSQPANRQISFVALMDSRSIMATAINNGALTSAENVICEYTKPEYKFNAEVYDKQVYSGFSKSDKKIDQVFGPNIVDWPKMDMLSDDIILQMASVITDDVTTTDELIPSGETSSYRSNPLKLSEFTLSRKDPEYVPFAKSVMQLNEMRKNGQDITNINPDFKLALDEFSKIKKIDLKNTIIASVIYANMPGDGSAREQAASCQKVLGGLANIARKYATKRYFSNLINWGIIPFTFDSDHLFTRGDYIFIPGIKKAIEKGETSIIAYTFSKGKSEQHELAIPDLTDSEKDILISGCLINYYRSKM